MRPNRSQDYSGKITMIKNIIFDFGGVLLDLDMQRSYQALGKITGKDYTLETLPDSFRQKVVAYETGKISTETFIWFWQNQCHPVIPQGDEIVAAWNAMLLGWQPAKFEFLDNLRTRYKVYLLSNTNVLHIEWVRRDLRKNHGISNFESRFFDKAYYSFELGEHKPDAKIFEKVLHDASILPEETLFIDDALINVQAAARLGIHGYHHNPQKNLISVFEQHGW